MNIYVEFKKDILRIKIGAEEVKIQLNSNYYLPVPGTETYYMFLNNTPNKKIKDLIAKHRRKLSLYRKFIYRGLQNRTFILVDKDVQELVTIKQLYDFAMLCIDSRLVYVIRKPVDFIDNHLESMENIIDSHITENNNVDVKISKLEEQ